MNADLKVLLRRYELTGTCSSGVHLALRVRKGWDQ